MDTSENLDKPTKKIEDRSDPSKTEAKRLDEKQKLLKPPGLPLAAVAALSGISL